MYVYVLIGAVLVLVAIANENDRALTHIDWIIYRKAINFGDTLTLFCEVDSCCKEIAGWAKWITNQSDFQTLILNARDTPYSEEAKYDGRISKSGIYLMIRNISSEDVEEYYSCTYGLYTSPKKLLTKESAFEERVTTAASVIGNYSEDNTVYMYLFLVTTVIFLAAFLVTLTFWCKSRKVIAELRTSSPQIDDPAANEEVENETPDFSASMQSIPNRNELDPLLNQSDCRTDASSFDKQPSVCMYKGPQVRCKSGNTVNNNQPGHDTNLSALMTSAMTQNKSPQTTIRLEFRPWPSSADTGFTGHRGFHGASFYDSCSRTMKTISYFGLSYQL